MSSKHTIEPQEGLRRALATENEVLNVSQTTPPEVPDGVGKRSRRRATVNLLALVCAIGMIATSFPLVKGLLRDPAFPIGQGETGPSLKVEHLPRGPLQGRRDATAIWTGKEFIVWGGWRGDQAQQTYFADGAAYNPNLRTWRTIREAPIAARASQVAVWTGSEMIIWGGNFGSPGIADGAAYNPVSDSWRKIAKAPTEARSNAKGFLVDGQVAVVGGTSPHSGPAATSVLFYNPKLDQWSLVRGSVPAYDAISIDSQIIIAGLRDSDGKLSFETVRQGNAMAVALPDLPIAARPSRLSLLSSGDSLIALTVDASWTKAELSTLSLGLASDRAGSTTWTVSDVAPDESVPDVNMASLERGLSLRVSDSAFVEISPYGTSYVNLATSSVSRRIDLMKGYCGASAAVADTGKEAFFWGGQTCQSTGPDVTNEGMVMELNAGQQ